jgi:NADH-quinone oxidoreductase subunit E
MTRSPVDDEAVRADAQSEPSLSSETGDPTGFAGWTAQGGPPLHPLMQHPTASVAAAAAVGFGMASHFAGFLLGAMQGFMDAAQKSAATAERERQEAEAATGTPSSVATPAVEPKAAETPVAPVAKAETVAGGVRASTAATVADMLASTQTVAKKVEAPASPAKPVKARRSKSVDDLKRISGVGPKIEQVLINMGVTRFRDIAAWTEDDIAKFDVALGVSGRIVRDKWIEQARSLAKGG